MFGNAALYGVQGLGRVLRAYVGHLARWEWFSNEGGVWAKSLQVLYSFYICASCAWLYIVDAIVFTNAPADGFMLSLSFTKMPAWWGATVKKLVWGGSMASPLS